MLLWAWCQTIALLESIVGHKTIEAIFILHLLLPLLPVLDADIIPPELEQDFALLSVYSQPIVVLILKEVSETLDDLGRSAWVLHRH